MLRFDLVAVDYLSLIGVLALPSWVSVEAVVVAPSVLNMVLGKNRAKSCPKYFNDLLDLGSLT